MKSQDTQVNNSLYEILKNTIINVLLKDTKTMPLNVLKIKTYKEVKVKNPSLFVEDEVFLKTIHQMKRECLIGENMYKKFFVDYLDYKHSDKTGFGYLEINQKTGNGFITIKEDINEYKKSSYFVHKKNLNSAKHGDYVKFVELIVTNTKHFNKFSLIDAAILEIVDKK